MDKSLFEGKVAICTTAFFEPPQKENENYRQWTDLLKQEYCDVNGYVFVHSDENPHPGRRPHFARFATLLYALCELKCRWAIWMDADAAPVLYDMPIDKLLLNNECYKDKVIIQRDILGWNSGVMAIPNTERAIRWLMHLDSEEIHEQYKDSPFFDQDAISFTIDNPDSPFKDMFIEPDHSFGFNNFDSIYDYGMINIPNRYISGKSWCLHIAGYGDYYRRIRFQNIYKNIHTNHCPVCGCGTEHYFSNEYCPTRNDGESCRIDVVFEHCPNCDFIYAPSFSRCTFEEMKNEFFIPDKIKTSFPDMETDDRYEKQFKEFALSMACNHARVLDYGGYKGKFASIMRQKTGLWVDSYDPYFSPEEGHCINDNGEAYCFSKIKDARSMYSVITCFDVLQHVVDPHSAFVAFSKLTTDDSTVIIKNPLWDLNNFDNRCVIPQKWKNLDISKGQINIWSMRSLEYMCSRYGFYVDRKCSNSQIQSIKKIPFSRKREMDNMVSNIL